MSLFVIRAIMLAAGLDAASQETTEVPSERQITGCQFYVDHPHLSHHVPGAVNVVARIQCDRTVDKIEMTLSLALNGAEQKRQTFVQTGTSYIQGNVAVSCVNGTYNGSAVATITNPPGANPQVEHGSANSAYVQITCVWA